MLRLEINIPEQNMLVFKQETLLKTYSISSGKKGVGEVFGSEQTPRGRHIIRAKIGHNCPVNTIFKARRPTGEIFNPQLRNQYPERDWILTRIMWLSGLDLHKNRLGKVDTMRRFIYIHGTPDDVPMGTPGSRGCIRMRNSEILELFDQVPVGTPVHIHE